MLRHDADGIHGMLENGQLAGLEQAIDLRQALQGFRDTAESLSRSRRQARLEETH